MRELSLSCYEGHVRWDRIELLYSSVSIERCFTFRQSICWFFVAVGLFFTYTTTCWKLSVCNL